MAFLDSKHQRAAFIVLALGAALLWALGPYATGIIGIPVLAILFAPVHNWLVRHGVPSAFAALVVTLLGAVLLIVPGILLAGLLINQAQGITQNVLQSPIIERFRGLQIRGIPVGPRLADAGGRIVAAIGASAFGLVGTATRLALNLTISFFGLYYVLKHGGDVWLGARPYIPFSNANTEKLGKRFKDVTVSTVIGTGVTAAIQGAVLGLTFWIVGLPNGLFWGVVTMAFAILPVVGSGMVWIPAGIVLIMQSRAVTGVLLIVWGVLVAQLLDNLARPLIYSRFSAIHPLITLIGAIGGVNYFGLLGLLVGNSSPGVTGCFSVMSSRSAAALASRRAVAVSPAASSDQASAAWRSIPTTRAQSLSPRRVMSASISLSAATSPSARVVSKTRAAPMPRVKCARAAPIVRALARTGSCDAADQSPRSSGRRASNATRL